MLLLLLFLSRLGLRLRHCHARLGLPYLLDFRLWLFGSLFSGFLLGLLLLHKLLHGLVELLLDLGFIGWLGLQ